MECAKPLMEPLKEITFMKAVWITHQQFIIKYKNGSMSTMIPPPYSTLGMKNPDEF